MFMSKCKIQISNGCSGRSVFNIHFYIESGQKFIQFNIQFKTKSKIFIQKIYPFKKIPNYSFIENIHSSEKWIITQGCGRLLPILSTGERREEMRSDG